MFKKLLGVVAAAMISTPSWAITYGDGGAALQGVLDSITQAGQGTDSSVDVTSDYLSDGADSFWAIDGSGGSVNTVVVELAGFANSNTFGIYDVGTGNSVELFGGSASTGSQVTVSILLDGSVLIGGADTGVDFLSNRFTYYLDSSASNGGGMFYSDTSLNTDGVDHMAAFQGVGDTIQINPYAAGSWGSNEYILAWEDLVVPGSDLDYTDFVVLVESVTAVPEPSTLALLGMGLLGFTFARRNRKA